MAQKTPDANHESIGPVGRSVADDHAEEYGTNPEYRRCIDETAPFEALARIVVFRRARLGITQAELARRTGTTASAISRIEAGIHRTRPETMKRLAEALGGRAVIGMVFDDQGDEQADLITV